MSPLTVALVAPMRSEIAPLVRRLARPRAHRAAGARWTEGHLRGVVALVAEVGDGQRAGERLSRLLRARRVDRLIIVGVAGALSPRLGHGRLVVGHEVRDQAGVAPAPNGDWVRDAARRAGAVAGTLISASRIATTPDEKAILWHHHGRPEPASVDLETASLARAAARHAVPYVAVRAISDRADETLPLDFNRWADGDGHVRQGAVAWHAMSHPWLMPELWRLGRRVAGCAERLADAAEGLLAVEGGE